MEDMAGEEDGILTANCLHDMIELDKVNFLS